MKFDHGLNPTNLIGETITSARIKKSDERYCDEDILEIKLLSGETLNIKADHGGFSHTERAIDEYPNFIVLDWA